MFVCRYNLEANDSVQASEYQHALYDDIAESQQQVKYLAGGAAQNTIRVAQVRLHMLFNQSLLAKIYTNTAMYQASKKDCTQSPGHAPWSSLKVTMIQCRANKRQKQATKI